MKQRGGIRKPAAVAVALLLVFTGFPWVDRNGTVPPFAVASSALIDRTLPADPADAAAELVTLIYGPDEALAQAAVAELLRRAGIPLVSIDGPVVALPDGRYLLGDFPVYIENIPDVTRAVRRGDYYEPAAVIAWLEALEIGAELPVEVFLGGLSQWGKQPDAPAISRSAAATVRALAGIRLEVLHAAAEPDEIHFDVLQALLILSHATADAWERDVSASLPTIALGPPAVRAQKPCDQLHDATKRQNWVEQRVTKEVKDKLVDGWKELAGEPVKNALETAGEAVEKGTAALSVLLLLLGAQLDLTARNVRTSLPRTHARGHNHQDSGDIDVIAHARFDSTLANKHIKCYALAGIDVPPSGNLNGFRIRWKIDQPKTARSVAGRTGSFLTPKSCCGGHLQSGSATGTGNYGLQKGDGRTKLELRPASERHPEAGDEHTGKAIVYAWIDEQDLPFKLDDAVDIGKAIREGIKEAGKVRKWTIDRLYDLALSAIKKAGLPKQRVVVDVTYHGADIYQIKGTIKLWLIFLWAPMKMDVVSCTGLRGPWNGDFSLDFAERTWHGEMTERIFGSQGVRWPAHQNALRASIRASTTSLQPGGSARFDIAPQFSALLTVSGSRYAFDNVGGTVGDLEVLINGQSTDIFSVFNGFGSRFPIVRLAEHRDCPGGDNLLHERYD